MQFIPTDDYREISMYTGLNAIQIGNADKLYSDGLDANEYIYFDPVKGFCYEKRTVAKATECPVNEDGCSIGGTYDQTVDILHSLKWCFNHKFYVKSEV